jgi:hypothetical protein
MQVCLAQMIVMVQHYFDTELFKDGKSPIVTDVFRSDPSGRFTIKTRDREEDSKPA